MANEEHVEIVRRGADAIEAFRELQSHEEQDFVRFDLTSADLRHADLSYAHLSTAELRVAHLRDADLSNAHLSNADLRLADLTGANLRDANLLSADLAFANLSDADLGGANLFEASLRYCILKGMSLDRARIGSTIFSSVNLGEVEGLNSEIEFIGPSTVDSHTLRASEGKIPDSFLRGCGFTPWEVLNAKLYDPLLKPEQIAEINDAIFKKRIGNPVGGIFISYSHKDTKVVELLHAALDAEGYSVWRDVHDLVSGPLERQVFSAIRMNDVVLLVLSKDSVSSNWCEAELEAAFAKEKREGRLVLCPITLDGAWEEKVKEEVQSVLWRKVKEKVILDFSGCEDDGRFDGALAKLLRGLPRYYGVREGSGSGEDREKQEGF